MKRYTAIIILSFSLIFFISGKAFSGNIFGEILKAYKTYQEVNMALWLTGDIGAEKRFGKELQMWMKLTTKFEKDPKINNYVKGIFYRLLPQYKTHGLKYDIHVIKSNQQNAFVIPGGHVYVYTGMIDFAKSDDELAAVIAHELGHAEKRHSLRNFRASTALVALLNQAVKNRKDRETWGALLSSLALMKFSRTQEDEADDIGQVRMYRAGFNPSSQITLWESFLKKHGDPKGVEQYLSSHPPSSKRVENAKNNLKKMNLTESKSYSNTLNMLSVSLQNYLANPGFESVTNGVPSNWQFSEGISKLDTTVSYTGKNSICMSSGNRMGKSRVVSDFIQINSTSKFDFTGWVKSENGNQSVSIGVELYDSSRRLRDRSLCILKGKKPANVWTEVSGTIENGKNGLRIGSNIKYMRLLLQSGLMTTGSCWFDDLRLKALGAADPVNLFSNGDFEAAYKTGVPKGLVGPVDAISRDFSAKKSGYASLKVSGTDQKEVVFGFEPLKLSNFKKDQLLKGSFYFFSNKQFHGRVVIEYLDSKMVALSRRLAQVEFETRPGQWQGTSFSVKLDREKDEDKWAEHLGVKFYVTIPSGEAVWLDNFIMR